MGDNASDYNEAPEHPVYVSPFYMDTTECRMVLYEELTGQAPWLKNEIADRLGYGDDYPAWGVNWYDAVFACNRRSKEAGLDTVYSYSDIDGEEGDNGILTDIEIHYDRAGYRLPTEAEWEFACRAGSRTKFHWGEETDSATAVQYIWSSDVSKSQPHEVAQLKPNQLNLYDMASSCFEWCNDWYEDEYIDSFFIDPIGPDSSFLEKRVTRSMSNGNRITRSGSARRSGGDPGSQISSGVLSFRMVLPHRPEEEE